MFETDGLCKRIIPCLDVHDGRTVKGVNFSNLRDVGDPVELALFYEASGADEIVFLDISASTDNRGTVIELVEKVAACLSIPFTVGGGVATLADARQLLNSGADKISINTAAVMNPGLIDDIAGEWGSQCCVVAIDARAFFAARQPVASVSGTTDSGARIPGREASRVVDSKSRSANGSWEVLIGGGRVATGMNAYQWALECVQRGAGEILLTSWDRDGTGRGFDIQMVREFADNLPVPVIASGGAQNAESFIEVFRVGRADAALAATIFHDGIETVESVKQALARAGVQVRL